MISVHVALLLFLFIPDHVHGTSSTNTGEPRKLLVILLDGFRWDYLDKFRDGELPGFTRLLQSGVSADGFIPVFPSLSYTNYYSIMTGLYAESHGMVDNYMYDERYDTEFLIGENDNQSHPYWWNDGEPLWVTASKQGKRSYFWFWCGCEVEIRGHRPTFCSPYQLTKNPSIANFSVALTQAVAVLRNDSADMAGVYFEQIDHDGHYFGPNSGEIVDVIRAIDVEMVKLLDAIDAAENINLMIFSDHGLAERFGGPDNATVGLINILDYIDESDWSHVAGSSTATGLQIWPKPGRENIIYEALSNAHPNLTVYRKADIPDRYHLKNHYRVPPLFAEADHGYVIVRNASTRQLAYIGFHGYDNMHEDMHGIFMAYGPDFKQNAALNIGRLPCVDAYQLMCHVMRISAAPHNGTWSNICDALVDSDAACASGPYDPSASAATSMSLFTFNDIRYSIFLLIINIVVFKLL